MNARDRKRGLSLVVAGIGMTVFAVILVGLTTASGAADWVSIATGAAGLVMVVSGLVLAFGHGETTPRST